MKAVAYARYSSDNQRAESIDAQLHDIREWAARNNCHIVKVYADEAKTGTTDDRDDFLQMITDLQKGYVEAEAVLVHKSDRFARNKWDAAIYKKALWDIGIKVIYVTQPMLSEDTPESFLMEGIFESLDQYYSLNLSREVMKGMKENARNCKHNGGRPPLGYDVDPKSRTYIVNEKEARAVRLVFEMYDQGFSYNAIIRELNAQGYKTKKGGTWGKNSIFDLLRNEKYTGVYVFNRTLHKIKGKRNNRKSKPEEQVIRIPGGIPQIIDQDLWNRVQAKMQRRSRIPGERAQNKAVKEYILTGKIECSKCGSKLVGKNGGTWNGKTRYDYYICNQRERKKTCNLKMVRRDIIEKLVLNELEKKILNPALFPALAAEIFKQMKGLGNESEKELVYLKAEFAKVQAKINNMIDLIENGAGSMEMANRLAQRESEKTILINRIQEIERKTKASTITEEMILAYLEQELMRLETDDTLTAKALIDRYVEKVIMYDDEFEVVFKILHTDGGGGPYHAVCRSQLISAKTLGRLTISNYLSAFFTPLKMAHMARLIRRRYRTIARFSFVACGAF